MTESSDTTTNYSSSDGDNSDYPIDLFTRVIDQRGYINDGFGLFYNDDVDDDEDNLTLFDLKTVPRSEHDLSIFDELAHQCDAVLLSKTDPQESTLSIIDYNSSSSKFLTTTMNNDYERRFQRSLQKLSIPSWYTEPIRSLKLSNKPKISSMEHRSRDNHRTPEIIHIPRPHSYRSCRSSLGTSPSPSAHSWHPNNFFDGNNFSSLLPSSSWSSRRSNKYEKGIERVSKSSHWYQPTQFVIQKTYEEKSTNTTIAVKKIEINQYDVPKTFSSSSHRSNLENRSKQCVNINPRLTLQRQAHCFMDGEGEGDVENTNIAEQHNNYHKANSALTYDKQLDNHIPSNEIAKMPLANENITFARIELEEITDDEENDKRSSTSNIQILSTVERFDEKNKTSIELFANHFVDSILTDVLHSQKTYFHDDDEKNLGVRELSDDENALRELDENEMTGTDEFILFATNPEDEENKNIHDDHSKILNINRGGNLNRLYTFTRSNDDGITNHSKKLPSNQDSSLSSPSVLMIVDKDISSNDSHSNPDANPIVSLEDEYSKDSPSFYRSHIQKRHINLGRYYDGMMRAKTSQLPTHDLRCNLALIEPHKSSEGVTEETVRKGRVLLNQMPDSVELKNHVDEHLNERPIRSILKQTRFVSPDRTETSHSEEQPLTIEEQDKHVSRRTVTTITEEFHRIHRQIIEEFDTEYPHSNNQERIITQESLISTVPRTDSSPYELLSECYSGYSFMRNKISKPVETAHLSNMSSLQSTTDEAYESETTVSARSPTISSSTAVTTTISTTPYVHPDLVHEFEYPSPPPPVPDRRLKPAHLRPPPPTKPRTQKSSQDLAVYSKIEKESKTSPLTSIQHLMTSTPIDSNHSPVRTLSSRHYCGTLPLTSESMSSPSDTPTNLQTDENANRNSKTQNLSSNEATQIKFKKSSSSSFNKSKLKKSSSPYFDEATNGLAIRLPVNQSNESDSMNKQNLTRSSISSSSSSSVAKRHEGPSKHRPISENLNADRSSAYETSV